MEDMSSSFVIQVYCIPIIILNDPTKTPYELLYVQQHKVKVTSWNKIFTWFDS